MEFEGIPVCPYLWKLRDCCVLLATLSRSSSPWSFTFVSVLCFMWKAEFLNSISILVRCELRLISSAWTTRTYPGWSGKPLRTRWDLSLHLLCGAQRPGRRIELPQVIPAKVGAKPGLQCSSTSTPCSRGDWVSRDTAFSTGSWVTIHAVSLARGKYVSSLKEFRSAKKGNLETAMGNARLSLIVSD